MIFLAFITSSRETPWGKHPYLVDSLVKHDQVLSIPQCCGSQLGCCARRDGRNLPSVPAWARSSLQGAGSPSCGFGVEVSPLLIAISCGVCHLLCPVHLEGSAEVEKRMANYRRAS